MKDVFSFLIITLLALATAANAAPTALFPLETFDTWTEPDYLPEGWTRIVGGTESSPAENANDWHPSSDSITVDRWHEFAPVATIYWSPMEIQDDWLISPTFDPTSVIHDSIVLEYETDFYAFDADTTEHCVLLSTDDGATWRDTLRTFGFSTFAAVYPADTHFVDKIDITDLTEGHTSCKIAFRAHRYTWNDFWWQIDNVCVLAYYFESIDETEAFSPDGYHLRTHPNPFNSAVKINLKFSPCQEGDVRRTEGVNIEIFDVNGHRVAQLPNGETVGDGFPVPSVNGRGDLAPTIHKFIWQPSPSLGSGVYLVRATVGDREAIKRIVYLK